MIWAMVPGLKRPGLPFRVTINVALVVAGLWLGYAISLLLDQEPPFDQARGTPAKLELAAGDTQDISWNYVDARYCRMVHVYRVLLSEADPDWVDFLWDSSPVPDKYVPRPRLRRSPAQQIRIPLDFPMKPDGSPTKGFYQVSGYAACNWLQEMLPERWRVPFKLPAVEFLVTRARNAGSAG